MSFLKIISTFFLALAILLFKPLDLGAQYTLDKKSQKKYNKIKETIKKGDNEKALEELESFILDNQDYLDAYIKKGNVLIELKDWEYAIESYNDLLALDPNYHDERLWYTLAFAHRQLKAYDDAVDNLKIVLSKLRPNSRLTPKIELEIEQIKFLKYAYENPVPFNPVPLDSIINTVNLEYLPAFNADGSKMVFTRRTGDNEDLYICDIINDSIQNIKAIEAINTHENEGSFAFSPSGNLIIFSYENLRDPSSQWDLFISMLQNGEWTKPVKMSSKFNSKHWESQPSISADGKTIFFASKRPGGIGGIDIWYVELNEYGKFSEAKNLGPTINTKGNDSSPFIHPDGQSLYFRSDTHPGMGDFDLFLSRKDSSGKWSIPVNLGYPINTEKSEGALFVNLNGSKAYYSSDQNTKPQNLDIFSFELPENLRPIPSTFLKARVIDKHTKKPLLAKLEITQLKTNDSRIHYSDKLNGTVLTALASGAKYGINIQAKGYLFYSKYIELDSTNNSYDPFVLEVELEKIKDSESERIAGTESEAIILENIFFESGSSVLKNESFGELKKLKTVLEQNDNISIRIIGHTDDVGSPESNLLLSEDRARAVKEQLEKMGLDFGRITFEGQGETMPIANNSSEKGRSQNRRIEFVVIYN